MEMIGVYFSDASYHRIREDFELSNQSIIEFMNSYPFETNEVPSAGAPLVEILNYFYLHWAVFTAEERQKIAEKIHTQIIVEYMSEGRVSL